MDDDTVRPGLNGHGDKGRFTVGNREARGNPNARKMFELRRVLLDAPAASPNLVEAVFTRLCRMALGEPAEDIPPDLEAMKLYLAYTVGRPMQAVEISGPDGEPLGGDFAALRGVILGVLARFPEARVEVAAALMRLRSADDGPDPVAGD